jgi:hypothetical protein
MDMIFYVKILGTWTTKRWQTSMRFLRHLNADSKWWNPTIPSHAGIIPMQPCGDG